MYIFKRQRLDPNLVSRLAKILFFLLCSNIAALVVSAACPEQYNCESALTFLAFSLYSIFYLMGAFSLFIYHIDPVRKPPLWKSLLSLLIFMPIVYIPTAIYAFKLKVPRKRKLDLMFWDDYYT